MFIGQTCELPSVLDSDLAAVDNIAPLLLKLVGAEIPAVGIRHSAQPNDERLGVHENHKLLIKSALKLVAPSINVNLNFFASSDVFSDGATSAVFEPDSPIHVDTIRYSADKELADLHLALRLHTADVDNGADVLLANSSSGLFEENGDDHLFDGSDTSEQELKERGYEFTQKLGVNGKLLRLLEGHVDPAVCDSPIYTFCQQPLWSVLFRLHTDIGPATIHKFTSLNRDIPRRASFSGAYFMPKI